MNTQSNAMPESSGSQRTTPAALSATRLLYWCVRRELWEYRSIYLAPLSIAGAILLGSLFVMYRLPHTMRIAMAMDLMHQREAISQHYDVATGLIMGAAFIVSIFYSLDALYGERRDRSILFWKSLPVSDLTVVLAKVSVPLLVLPVVAFVITLVTLAIMLLLSSMVLLANGLSVGAYWSLLQPFESLSGLLNHLITVHILWYAPLYAWLLMISAWARRAPFLWVVLPPLAVGIFEKVAFRTMHFANFIGDRVSGGNDSMNQMQGTASDPGMHVGLGHFLAQPGLWIGLACAALFLYIAARLRRYRGPI